MKLDFEVLPDQPKQKLNTVEAPAKVAEDEGFDFSALPDQPGTTQTAEADFDFSLLPDQPEGEISVGQAMVKTLAGIVPTMGDIAFQTARQVSPAMKQIPSDIFKKMTPAQQETAFNQTLAATGVVGMAFPLSWLDSVVSGPAVKIQEGAPALDVVKEIPLSAWKHFQDMVNLSASAQGKPLVFDAKNAYQSKSLGDVWGNYYEAITGQKAPTSYKMMAGIATIYGLSPLSPEFKGLMKKMGKGVSTGATKVTREAVKTVQNIANLPNEIKIAYGNVMKDRALANDFVAKYGKSAYKALRGWEKEMMSGMGEVAKPEYVLERLMGVKRPAGIVRPAELPRDVTNIATEELKPTVKPKAPKPEIKEINTSEIVKAHPEAAKTGKIIGIDAKTRLPIVDTVAKVTPAETPAKTEDLSILKPEQKEEVSVEPKATPAEGKVGLVKDDIALLKEVTEGYESDKYTIEDIAERLEDIQDKDIERAVDDYKNAVEEDRTQYGKRSGLPEEYGDKLMALVEQKLSTPVESKDLLAEAKKYKTAEEFVESQKESGKQPKELTNIWKNSKQNIIVDNEDLKLLSKYSFSTKRSYGYPAAYTGDKTKYLHDLVLGIEDKKGMVVDHINGNPLDNRKENLQLIPQQLNVFKMKTPKTNVSGVKGVKFDKRINKWIASIAPNRKTIHLGSFEKIEDAIKARQEGEKKYIGDIWKKAQEGKPEKISPEPTKVEKAIEKPKGTKQGKVVILPDKEKLLSQIEAAIKKAPDIEPVMVTFEGEQVPGYPSGTPTVSFKIDGGAKIYNTKAALQKFYDKIKRIAPTIAGVKELAPKGGKPHAQNMEDIGELFKGIKGYFTDGMLLIKGEPPANAKFEERGVTQEQIQEMLNNKTEPAVFQYYTISDPDNEGVSLEPIYANKKAEYRPVAIFKSGDLYYGYDQFRFAAITNRFPKLNWGIGKDKGLLIGYENNKPVAVLMPVALGESITNPSVKIPPLQELAEKLMKPAKKATVKKTVEKEPPKGAFVEPPEGLPGKTQSQLRGSVEMPELVKLAKQFLGNSPIVKKLKTALGKFLGIRGIKLSPEIFKNPYLAAKVLGHEIGHLFDWLQDMDLARGNILGRIGSLKKYMKTLLPEFPGEWHRLLTPKDRTRLRAEAMRQLKEEYKLGTREIIEEIIKEIPIYEKTGLSVDDILAVWREGTTREVNPILYDFVAKLSSAEKKDIIKQALKGLVDERLRELGGGKRVGTRIEREKIKRVIEPEPPTKEATRRRYKQLLKQEIIKRRLFEKETIMEELKRNTHWWNPFDAVKFPVYTKYRYRSEELYAEAISVLLNQPEALERNAPTFYRAFWNYIEQKPEVKQALLDLENFLALSETEKLKIREMDIRTMFTKGEHLFYEARTEYQQRQKDLWFLIRNELIDKNQAILDKIVATEKGKRLNPEDNPRYYLESHNYVGGKIKNLLERISKHIITPLLEKEVSLEDFGEYLFLRRVVTERKDIANPLGHNRETAAKQLDYLKESLGAERFAELEKADAAFREVLRATLNIANEAGLFKQETFADIITNQAYATFQVLDHLDDYITPAVIQQVGTLKEISNPFTSTVIKVIGTLRATERIKVNNSIIKFMQANHPNEIETAKIRRFGKYKAEIVLKEGYGIIKTREAGKLRGYYVDPYIADSVNYDPRPVKLGVIKILKFFNQSYFRPIYVGINLGFQSYNLFRDFVRAWKLNPDVTFPQMLKNYTKAIPIAKQRVWGKFSDETLTKMQEEGMLSFSYNDLLKGKTTEEEGTQIEYLLKRYDILKEDPKNAFMYMISALENLGDFIETLPKVTGYLSRLKSGLSMPEIAHEVRVYSGSPDFLRKGKGYEYYNNIFLFFNAFKEGFRGDFEGGFKNPRTRRGYWWRTVKLNILPKILMFLGGMGLFGAGVQKMYEKVSEYDKTNYTIIPFGLTPEGECIYLRIPNDEVGRLIGGLFWKGITLQQQESGIRVMKDIANLTAGQLPSIAPLIELAFGWIQYATGQQAYDFFKGKLVLSDVEKKAGGWYSLQPMLEWTGQKLALPMLTAYAWRKDEKAWKKVLKLTPVLQRYIKISNWGEEEKKRQKREKYYQKKATYRIKRYHR